MQHTLATDLGWSRGGARGRDTESGAAGSATQGSAGNWIRFCCAQVRGIELSLHPCSHSRTHTHLHTSAWRLQHLSSTLQHTHAHGSRGSSVPLLMHSPLSLFSLSLSLPPSLSPPLSLSLSLSLSPSLSLSLSLSFSLSFSVCLSIHVYIFQCRMQKLPSIKKRRALTHRTPHKCPQHLQHTFARILDSAMHTSISHKFFTPGCFTPG